MLFQTQQRLLLGAFTATVLAGAVWYCWPQPTRPMGAIESASWDRTPCEYCGGIIGTKSKADGLFFVGQELKVLHNDCAAKIAAAHKRKSRGSR